MLDGSIRLIIFEKKIILMVHKKSPVRKDRLELRARLIGRASYAPCWRRASLWTKGARFRGGILGVSVEAAAEREPRAPLVRLVCSTPHRSTYVPCLSGDVRVGVNWQRQCNFLRRVFIPNREIGATTTARPCRILGLKKSSCPAWCVSDETSTYATP
jgi:hypothetical protein